MIPALPVGRLWASVVLVNLIVAAMVGLTLRQSHVQYEERADVTLENFSLVLAGNLASTLSKIDLVLQAEAEEASAQLAHGGFERQRLEASMKRQFGQLPELSNLAVMDAHGDLVYSVTPPPPEGVNYADRDYFRALKDDPRAALVISKPLLGRIKHVWQLVLARRLTAPDGSFAGLVFAGVTLEYIQKNVFSTVNIGKQGLITLWDKDHAILVRYPEHGNFGSTIGQKAQMPEFQELLRTGRDTGIFRGLNPRDHIRRTYSYRKIPGYPLSLTVGMGSEEYLADWRTQARFLAAMTCLFILATLYAARTIQGNWRRLEAATRAAALQEEKFRSLVENTDDLVWETDANGIFTYVSPKSRDILGYEPSEMVGRSPYDFKHPSEGPGVRAHIAALKRKGDPIRCIGCTTLRKDGTPVVIETNGVPIFDENGALKGYHGIDRDVTERERLREMLVQTEKMASVGRLAAGMAHEINNPLGGILQSAQVLARRFTAPSPANDKAAKEAGCDFDAVMRFLSSRDMPAMLAGIRESAVRAARIVGDLLGFSRQGDSRKRPANLAKILDQAVELCSTEYDLGAKFDFKSIRVEREYDPALPKVECSPTQIEQVILNLLRNTAQALAESPSLDREPAIFLRTRLEGENARVEVEDNGPGMDDKTRRRVFEPFFTTKPPGLGTGLGLSVSYFIITKNHGGTIRVESQPGRGARFIITLPLADKGDQDQA